jgi:hypothetical protein
VSSTTNDGKAEEATPLAYAEDAERLNLPTGHYAEQAKDLGQPIGVYGVGKFGECRTETAEELRARKGTAPGSRFETGTDPGLYRVDSDKTEA